MKRLEWILLTLKEKRKETSIKEKLETNQLASYVYGGIGILFDI